MKAQWLNSLRGLCLFFVFLSSIFSLQVYAEDVSIGMGNFEPYFIEKGESGIFTDLIKVLFKKIPGYEPKFLFGRSNNRLWHEFKQGKLDAVSNLFDSIELKACRSDPVFRFRDMAISKRSSAYIIKSVADLAGKDIVTFQGAKEFFGKEFAAVIMESAYQEVARPSWQVKELYSGSAQVSIGDMFIFLDSLKKREGMGSQAFSPKDFVFHDILPAVYSTMGFRSKHLCGLFNLALKDVRESGEYEKVYEGYLSKLNYSIKD